MKKILFLFSFFIFSLTASAEDFYFDKLSIQELIKLVYGDVLKKNYTLDNDVINLDKKITLDWKNVNHDELQILLSDVLRRYEINLESIATVNHLSKLQKKPDLIELIYKPKFRDVLFLQNVIVRSFGLSQNLQVSENGTENPNSNGFSGAGNTPLKSQDSLVLYVPTEKYTAINAVLDRLDVSQEQVDFKLVVYEYNSDKKDSRGLGLSIAKNILGTKLGLSIASIGVGNTLSLGAAGIKAVIDALKTDNNFKLISSPSVRVASGSRASLNVGAQVPVLGSVVQANNSQPVQSIEYKQSGVTLDVKPVVLNERINVDLKQTLSNFINTTTGLAQTPTLVNRSIETQLSLKDSELILIGGLIQQRANNQKTGLPIFDFSLNKTDENNASELLIFIQVDKTKET